MLISRETLDKKKQIILAAVLVACLGVIAITLSSTFGSKKSSSLGLEPAMPVAGSAALRRIQGELPLGITETQEYQNLKKFGNWPLAEEQKGKANPFLPIFNGE